MEEWATTGQEPDIFSDIASESTIEDVNSRPAMDEDSDVPSGDDFDDDFDDDRTVAMQLSLDNEQQSRSSAVGTLDAAPEPQHYRSAFLASTHASKVTASMPASGLQSTHHTSAFSNPPPASTTPSSAPSYQASASAPAFTFTAANGQPRTLSAMTQDVRPSPTAATPARSSSLITLKRSTLAKGEDTANSDVHEEYVKQKRQKTNPTMRVGALPMSSQIQYTVMQRQALRRQQDAVTKNILTAQLEHKAAELHQSQMHLQQVSNDNHRLLVEGRSRISELSSSEQALRSENAALRGQAVNNLLTQEVLHQGEAKLKDMQQSQERLRAENAALRSDMLVLTETMLKQAATFKVSTFVFDP